METKNKNIHSLRNLFARAVAIMELTVENGADSELNSKFSSTLKEIEEIWGMNFEETKNQKVSGED